MQIDWSKIFSYINKRADRRTVEEVESWRKKNARNEVVFRKACDYYNNDPTQNESFSEEQLSILFVGMQRERLRRRKRVFWQRMTVAASVILLFSVGTWKYYDDNAHLGLKPQVSVVENRVPEVIVVTESGDQFTTEQLSSNVARHISDNKLEYSANELVTGEKDTIQVEKQIPTHTIIVPRGRTFELVLSDGTFVLLSPSSELTYPVQFDSCSTREVTLRGEAYFEVTKSSRRFAVNTDRMKLQVYGTTFNVLAREEAPDEAVLLEGVVGITPKHVLNAHETVLHPGNKSSIDGAGLVTVVQTDLSEYTAKRNGYLLFNGKTIEQIVRSLEFYYDVNFKNEDTVLGEREYVFSIKRESSLREALDVIEFVADVKFMINGKEVSILSK